VAAVALFILAAEAEGKDVDYDTLRSALASFSGVKRRFEFYVNTPKAVYMDDYAHHPRELSAAITSVKRMFPERKLTAIFQPHLYTRTRDLYAEFAQALSLADQVVLLPIYPARELSIEGICSQIIADRVTVKCTIVEREQIAQWLTESDTDVVVSFGAGNIDAYCQAMAEVIEAKSR
jgi:UDP-N-acetylmuramate--alanine ligase